MTTSALAGAARRRARNTLILSTALGSGLLAATPALAQSATPPPTRFVVDANGIDLATGHRIVTARELTIGSGDGMLALDQVRDLNTSGSRYSQYLYHSGATWSATVFDDEGPRTYAFTQSGSSYSSTTGEGATFAPSGSAYVLTLPDGTRYTYGETFAASGDPGTLAARLSAITQPDGTTVTIGWGGIEYCTTIRDGCAGGVIVDAIRLQSLTNSFGYQMHYNYAGSGAQAARNGNWYVLNSVTAFNEGVDYCDPTALTCSFTQNWPSVSYGVTESGAVTTTYVSDPAGGVTRYTADTTPGAIRFKIERPASSADDIVVSYDGSGRVSSVANDGRTWGYSFSLSGTTMTAVVTNPDATTRTVVSDTNVGLPTSVTDETGHTTLYHYDASGRLDKATAPEGGYVQYAYDSRGNVTSTTAVAKSGSGLANIVTSADYPSSCTNPVTCNQPTWTKDALGNQTDYSYDPTHGGVLTVTRPAASTGGTRPKTTYGYTALQAYYKNGAAITASGVTQYELTSISTCQTGASCAGTADEAKTLVSYGPQTTGTANTLLPVSVTKEAGDGTSASTTTLAYDMIGNATAVDGPLSGSDDTVTYRYDADRRRTGTIAPDPDGAGSRARAAERLTYNADGQVTLAEAGTVTGTSDTAWAAFAPAQSLATAYDTSGRRTSATLAAGGTPYAVTQYSYDSVGRLQCTAQRMNSAAWGTLPSDACTLQTAGSYGPDRIVKATYDDAGRQTRATSAYGTTDAADDATATYNADGTTATLTDANGNTTSYDYDGFDRLAKTRYPDGTTGSGTSSTTDYEALVYDANGSVTSRHLRGYASDSTQHIDYSYDHLNRVTAKDLPGSELDVSYGYDLLDRLTSAATSAQTLTVGYDALSRMTSQGGPLGTMSVQYDAAGERTRLTWPDTFYVTYDYDSAGNLLHVRENGASSGIGVLATYGYDDLGRRTSLTRGNGTSTTYTPDAVSRLSSLAHDLSGTTNNVTTTFAYNPASQIASITRSNDAYAASFANAAKGYTINGLNQATAVTGASMSYDARGNTTAIGSNSYTYPSENLLLTGPSSAALTYDPLLRLYQTSATGFAATRFQYDGLDMVGEYDSSGTLQKRYVFGGGGDDPIVEYDKSGSSYTRAWLYADERGSVIAHADDTGAVTAINSYDEYGVPGASNAGRFGYTGQAWLPELGFWYYKARMYAPALGRFLQTDPIGYGDGLNWYGYVGGDPVNFTDPLGLAQVCIAQYETSINDDGTRTVTLVSMQCENEKPRYGFTSGSLDGAGITGGASEPTGRGSVTNSQQNTNSRSRLACLKNIDANTWGNLGLDAAGAVASWTGLKAAWEAGSAAIGISAGLVAITSAALNGSNKEQGIAGAGAIVGFGTVVIPHLLEDSVGKKVLTSIPVVGGLAATGILGYDGYQALKKAGCF